MDALNGSSTLRLQCLDGEHWRTCYGQDWRLFALTQRRTHSLTQRLSREIPYNGLGPSRPSHHSLTQRLASPHLTL